MPAREARAVNDREALVAEVQPDVPGSLEIGHSEWFDSRRTGAEPVPESLRDSRAQSRLQQQPGLDQHVISGDERLSGAQDGHHALMLAIATVRTGIEGRTVDEQRHRRGCSASRESPMYSSLCRPTSEPPLSPSGG